MKSLEAVEPLRLSEWAAQHFYLSAESSYVEKRWEAYPFQVALMDFMSNDEIEEFDLMKAARVGYTKMILAKIAYNAEHRRRNQAIWQPTDDDADDFCKTELEPMLRDVSAMEAVFPFFMQRHKDNTLKQKKFLGSVLHIRGAKAAKNFRRISIDDAILDEVDGCDQDIEKEGDIFILAGKRLEGATYPKLIAGTTPKLRGFSNIEPRFEMADKRFRFHVPCPHCDTEIQIRWGGEDKPYGFKWVGGMQGDPTTVGHLCEHCGSLFTQAEYFTTWVRGRWIAEDGTWYDQVAGKFRSATGELVPTPRHVAAHIWTGYSPQADWEAIVREYLAAYAKLVAGDKSAMKTFKNTTLGETWEEEIEKTDESELMKRAEDYQLRTVPRGALVLVAGVDVQSNRFHVNVWGFGRGEEMWIVDRMEIDANPADERDWEERLEPYLQTRFLNRFGIKIGIEAVAIDTGGHFTHQAYRFCRARERRKYFAVKGESRPGKPVKGRSSLQDVNFRGKVIKSGVRLWMVGTDTAKDLFAGRLAVQQPGPGCVHFSREMPPEFYLQLTAEARVLQKTSSGEEYRWVKQRGRLRNEDLDCTVYAIFCAHALDLHRYTDRMWEKLEAAVQPPTADLFGASREGEQPDVQPVPAAVLQRQNKNTPPKRGGGFAKRW